MKNLKIKNKTILITGGSSGIGLELNNKLKEQNTVITLGTRESKQENYYVCDVSDSEQVKQAVSLIVNKFGKFDIIINNAGYGMSGATELICVETQKKMIDVNLFGIVNIVQNTLQHLNENAKIINISSASGLFCVPYRTMYAVSKSAVNMLTNGLRMELNNTSYQVTAICPGNIKTNFTKNRVKEFETNSLYGNQIEESTLRLDSKEDKRMSVDKATDIMLKIISKKKLKPYYIIGNGIKALNFFQRFVPKSLVEKITIKTMLKK